MTDDRRINEIAGIMKALGHPTRLFIVEEVAREPHCVCELTALIGADTSTVSRHLSVLKNAGILRDEKRGNLVYYSLTCPCVLESVRRLMPVLDMRKRHYTSVMEEQLPARRMPGPSPIKKIAKPS